ncbi:phosphoribosyltransferase family protein [Stackebrandtia soli]|uniref:phosphoribosyltransferase family protein n=1 Tax=Stackebrandtia soli TaxID=1892856 RepID=UPI0039ED1B35
MTRSNTSASTGGHSTDGTSTQGSPVPRRVEPDGPDLVAATRARLLAATRWRHGRIATLWWWTDARLLRLLGPGLAALWTGPPPTVVVGVQSSGYLLAPLVATRLGVGMFGVQQRPGPDGTTLAAESDAIGPGDRVLLVDDIAETAEQIAAVRDLITHYGATWLGASVMVAYRDWPELGINALASIHDLPRSEPGYAERS